MYRFSIVVPMVGSASSFELTLASILRYRPESCQVIVAHDGSYDDPHGLAGEIELVSTKQHPHLVRLFNCGLRVAKGELVGLVRPGVELGEGWEASIADAFEDEKVGSVTPAIVSREHPARLVCAGVSTSFKYSRQLTGVGKKVNSPRLSKLKPLAPTTWAAFYRCSLLSSLGSCDEQLDPQYLDVDLGLSLQNLKFECVFRPDCIFTINDASLIENEARLSHGRSAQRTMTRQRDLSNSQRLTYTVLATLTDLLTMPLGWVNLQHACQRFGAIRLRSIDRHHMELLKLLHKQRQRLIEHGSQRRERAIRPESQSVTPSPIRRAA